MPTFFDPGELTDGDLRLVLRERRPADLAHDVVPEYVFDITLGATWQRVGTGGQIARRWGAVREIRPDGRPEGAGQGHPGTGP